MRIWSTRNRFTKEFVLIDDPIDDPERNDFGCSIGDEF